MIATPERQVEEALPEQRELGWSRVSRRLIAAAMLIERDGWCQGKAMSADGRRCITGAIYMVGRRESAFLSPDYFKFRAEGDLAMAWLDRWLDDRWSGFAGIVGWNDETGRTKEEVLALLELAARGAEP